MLIYKTLKGLLLYGPRETKAMLRIIFQDYKNDAQRKQTPHS